jgi:hypothetical protein
MVEISQLDLKTEYMGKYTWLYLKRKNMGRVPADLNVEGVHGGSLAAHLPDEGVQRRPPPPRLYLKREGLSPAISEEEASSPPTHEQGVHKRVPAIPEVEGHSHAPGYN